MNKFLKTFVAAAVAALVAAPALAEGPISPAGEWQMSTGEARYRIDLCGDGTQVCATLTWLRNDVATAENRAYLNKQVVTGAERATNVKWRGAVTYQGETFNGALTVLDANTIKLTGCRAVACDSLMLTRI